MSAGKPRQSLFAALIVLSTLLLSPCVWGQKTATVPLDHWAYDIVDRFQTRGYLTNISDLTRPYTRGEFVAFILRADSVLTASSDLIDHGLLQKLKAEFREDLEDCGIWLSDLRGQSHLVKWHGDCIYYCKSYYSYLLSPEEGQLCPPKSAFFCYSLR